MEEELKKYLGQIVALSVKNGSVFGVLQTNGEKFGFNNVSFVPDNVEEVVPIEVAPEVNMARANIKLK